MPEGIAYQNKDIEFKVLSEVFKESHLKHTVCICQE